MRHSPAAIEETPMTHATYSDLGEAEMRARLPRTSVFAYALNVLMYLASLIAGLLSR
jgi:hypothetical protein